MHVGMYVRLCINDYVCMACMVFMAMYGYVLMYACRYVCKVMWETACNDRSAWRKIMANGVKEIEAKRHEGAKRRHDVRHGTTGEEAANIQCNRCYRHFLHRIRLASHVRHHHPS